MVTLIESDLKAPFQYLPHRDLEEGATSFPGLLDPYFITLGINQGDIFWVFGMTQAGIEPVSAGSLANIDININYKLFVHLFLLRLHNTSPFVNQDGFSIKQPTQIDLLLNKDAKQSICINYSNLK